MPTTKSVLEKLDAALDELKTVEDISVEARADFVDELEELRDSIEEELENPEGDEDEQDDGDEDDLFDD